MYIHVYVCVYIYIYICISREREREREREIYLRTRAARRPGDGANTRTYPSYDMLTINTNYIDIYYAISYAQLIRVC